MNIRLIGLCLLALCATGFGTQSPDKPAAPHWFQQKRLIVDSVVNDERFGNAVAISADGNTAVIGALSHDEPGCSSQGAAYVFTRSGESWVQHSRLLADNPSPVDHFGYSVAISADGNRIVVGATTVDVAGKLDHGAAYVFGRQAGKWSSGAPLFPSGIDAGANYGRSVSISADGNTVAVGALWADGEFLDQGTVSIFVWNGSSWAQQVTLTAADPAVHDLFGVSVSLSADGETAVVGAAYDDVNGRIDQGSAYVFARHAGTWTQQAHLIGTEIPGQPGTASDTGDGFGRGVRISGDGNTILIGAAEDRVSGVEGQGSVYVYRREGTRWTAQARLLAEDGKAKDGFGRTIALSFDGTTSLVGAESVDGVAINQGAAYVFRQTGGEWKQHSKLMASDGGRTDLFGTAVDLTADGSAALVGALCADVGQITNQGSAYYFRDMK